jgi:hypothetical protein
MKTRLLNTPAPAVNPVSYPALYRSRDYGHIYFASGPREAVIIHGSVWRVVGEKYDAAVHGDITEQPKHLERIEGPVAVEFQSR